MTDEVLMTVQASPMRKYFGASTLAVLGFMMVYLGVSLQGEIASRAILTVGGAFMLWSTGRLLAAASQSLELTADELRASSGQVLARINDIEKVDRGTFAFKPSHGFIVIMKERQLRAWSPGMWWRLGRRIGVGGITNGGQNKAMAEMMTMLLASRDSENA
ncbi:MAG: hypothetical protein P8L68_09915 [Paracoccaceae bacterium]|nr:hypothetical protein [Paracoccaceae bacterium]MDG2258794.1 hypothetical protein [Paracoccaceae bacterium]